LSSVSLYEVRFPRYGRLPVYFLFSPPGGSFGQNG
jgi:hypothetical protein